jgi:hypothetical protein
MPMHRIYDWFRQHTFAVDCTLMLMLLAFTSLIVAARGQGLVQLPRAGRAWADSHWHWPARFC